MRLTSRVCDKAEHGKCDGTCVYMDQDGPNHYICDCDCHAAARREREERHALAKVRKFLRTEGLDRRYEVVAKASLSGNPEPPA